MHIRICIEYTYNYEMSLCSVVDILSTYKYYLLQGFQLSYAAVVDLSP